MAKKKKPKIEFRYYKMPAGTPILALLGQKWKQSYGRDIDYLHFHNYLEIGYCYEGRGVLQLGEEELRFGGGEFTIIPKNYPHTTNSDPGTISSWEYLFIDVEGFVRDFLSGGGNSKRADRIIARINSRALKRRVEESPKIAGMIRGILDIMRNTEELYIEEAKGILAALLVAVARENRNGEPEVEEMEGRMTIPVSRALDYITLHYMEPLKIEDLAAWSHISETHFRRIFSKYMNMSPLEYINLVRIRAACAVSYTHLTLPTKLEV